MDNRLFRANRNRQHSNIDKILQYLEDYFKNIMQHINASTINPKIDPLTDLQYIYSSIIDKIKHASSDAEALQNVIQFAIRIPIEHNDEKMSYGDFLGLEEPTKMISLPTGGSLSDDNLKVFHQFYKQFLNAYKSVPHMWEYSYPTNENGEIMTPMIQFWQDQMVAEASDNTSKNKAIKDFKRSFSIENQLANIIPERLDMNAKQLCLISLSSMGSIKMLENQDTTAYIIHIENPNGVYYQNKGNNDGLCKITMSEDQLEEFNKEMHPTNKVQFINIYRLTEEQIKSMSPIMHKLREDDISHNITELCKKLNNSKLYAAWLNKCGGQNTNRFVDFALLEKHLGEAVALGNIIPSTINWTVKENPVTHTNELTLEYSIGVKSVIMNGDVYAKHRANIFTKNYLHPEQINNNIDQFDTILKIDANVVVNVERNQNNKLVMVPKLTEFNIASNALLSTGETLLKSPAENPGIMEVLKSKAKKTPSLK